MRVIGEINAGLYDVRDNIRDKAYDRMCVLDAMVADYPAHTLEGVAAKLHLANYWFRMTATATTPLTSPCAMGCSWWTAGTGSPTSPANAGAISRIGNCLARPTAL